MIDVEAMIDVEGVCHIDADERSGHDDGNTIERPRHTPTRR
ncbi:hypothetical protein [Bifidobacterium sp. UTCIF-39]|nr:hypothetical protein [Bifidobacterium sp. UTCIF-39]